MHDPSREFPDGVALIAGGSGGVGSAVAVRLAQAGASVALTYRNDRDGAERAAEAVRAAGAKAEVYRLALADAAQVEQLVARVAEAQGRIHTVVCAAGTDIEMRFIGEVTPAEWHAVIESDLNGFFHLVQAVLPHLRAGGGGSLVAVTSAGLKRFAIRDILSVAPKAAIESLVVGIAREEGRHGIRANSVALGVIETGIFHRLKGRGISEAWVEAARSNTALKRFGTAEEVAEVVAFLASPRAAYVTGQSIAVDGGYSL